MHRECEGGIEKSVPMIIDYYREAVMTVDDREGPIFLSHHHTNNGLFFLLTTKYRILYWKKTLKMLPDNPEFAEMRHNDVILTTQLRHGSTCGLVHVCEIE